MVISKNLLISVSIALIFIGVSVATRLVKSLKIASESSSIANIPYSSNPESSFYEAFDKPESSHRPQGPVRQTPTARSYVVGDVLSGKIYLQKNSSLVLPVASMSKLITAIVAKDTLQMDKVTEITPEETAVAPDLSRIGQGEKFTHEELLVPLLLSSSNIAAEALASSTDRRNFLETMSSYAWEIGMPSAFFADPSGLSPQNAASANDLFALAKYLYKTRPEILALTRIPSASIATTSDHGSHTIPNIHPFANDPRFIGGKTGRTPEAGDTMMTILWINDRPVALVILGAEHGMREPDTLFLIRQVESLI